MPALSSSGTLGKPLNISRNGSDHHKCLYFLKNSTELLPHDWPYGCHPLVTFLHFLHMWAHKMYISPQKGMLLSLGDNMVLGFAFHFSMSSSAHLRWLSIWGNHLIVSWLSCSYLPSFTSPLSYPHFEATHVLAALHVSPGYRRSEFISQMPFQSISAALLCYMQSRQLSQNCGSVRSTQVQLLCINFGKCLKPSEPHFYICMMEMLQIFWKSVNKHVCSSLFSLVNFPF